MISSRSNTTIKQVRSLRNRKDRNRTGLFVIEGVRMVAEAIQLGIPIELLVVAPDLLISPFGRTLAQERKGASHIEVTPDVFASMGLGASSGPQGIAAVVRQRRESLWNIALSGSEAVWIALDSVQYPGNLGTILRTSDAVGAEGVILLGSGADPHDPAAVRASLGAVLSQRIVRASFQEFADWKSKHGIPVVGTSPAASRDYRSLRYSRPLVLLMGSEGAGISSEHRFVCDDLVSIPMVGRSDSLNLAVATAIVLYEVFDQQRHTRAGTG